MYDADGNLLQRTVTQTYPSSSTTVTAYVNGIEYKNGSLEAIYHEEGRYVKQSGTWRHEYVLKDHLGNSRLFFSDINGNGFIEISEVTQEQHYYPYGMAMEGNWYSSISPESAYRYNGIEHTPELGLGVYNAFYRTLDPATARWWQVDPAAESFYGMTPYNAMGNSPAVFSDPEGDLFFVIPQIGIGKGGLSIGIELGIGIPGVSSLSLSGGYTLGSGSYWSVQGYASGFYAGYGSKGAFAGFGYQYAGFQAGLTYGKGGWSFGVSYGENNGSYAGSFGLSYGKGGLGFNASASSIYMWGALNPGVTNESGTYGELQGGANGIVKGNTGLYEDETLAYNVMVEQTKGFGVETAAWLTDRGVLISPIETPEYKNTARESSNNFYKVTISGKKLFAHFLGKRYNIIGQIHTHPTLDIGLSKADKGLIGTIKRNPVYTIGPSKVHKGFYTGENYFMNYFGATHRLLSGKLKIINP
ncbi:MAG: hypothetical protein H6559_04455 [Lewinellaceae bacterium]|nr:hypothetical protein [Lewinellaceae bacterium]